jgi:hypothetical protein
MASIEYSPEDAAKRLSFESSPGRSRFSHVREPSPTFMPTAVPSSEPADGFGLPAFESPQQIQEYMDRVDKAVQSLLELKSMLASQLRRQIITNGPPVSHVPSHVLAGASQPVYHNNMMMRIPSRSNAVEQRSNNNGKYHNNNNNNNNNNNTFSRQGHVDGPVGNNNNRAGAEAGLAPAPPRRTPPTVPALKAEDLRTDGPDVSSRSNGDDVSGEFSTRVPRSRLLRRS